MLQESKEKMAKAIEFILWQRCWKTNFESLGIEVKEEVIVFPLNCHFVLNMYPL